MKDHATPATSKTVIFTDLDGTLLSEETYDPGPARPALEQCRSEGIPVIFCSSKTAAEIIALRKNLGNTDPFITENGGAIYIPRETPLAIPPTAKNTRGFAIIEIGAPISKLRAALKTASEKSGTKVKGMGKMTLEDVCQLTGLKKTQAGMAMKRQYDEPFILVSGNAGHLETEVHRLGYALTRGGRFFHALGGSDKGKAVQILSHLYRARFGIIQTFGIGDAENDLPMFKSVDRAFLVKKPTGKWAAIPPLPNLEKIDAIGPEGWVKAIHHAIKAFL